MGDFAKRRPAQLSGGQHSGWRWRGHWCSPEGAAARRAARCVDAKLRKQLQLELRAVQREVGITFVTSPTTKRKRYHERPDRRFGRGSYRAGGPAPGDLLPRRPPPSSPDSWAPPTSLTPTCSRPATVRSCSALGTRLGAAVEDGAAKPGEAAIVIRPERITVQGADEPVGQVATPSQASCRRWSTSATARRCTSTSEHPLR